MKSEYAFSPFDDDKKNEMMAPSPSRLTDEKISDENGVEAQADSIHRPAGLDNPFWN